MLNTAKVEPGSTCALPDEPVFTVTVDPSSPNDVYIGTEFGVYVNTPLHLEPTTLQQWNLSVERQMDGRIERHGGRSAAARGYPANAGSGNPGTSTLIAEAALVGHMLADNKALATLPLALQQLTVMATTIPASPTAE